MPNVVTRAAASRDIAAAARWYNKERPGLGNEFVDAVFDTVARIISAPEQFPIADAEIRRVTVDRFPHAVSFRARPDEIVIVACTHYRRHPRHWRNRR